MWKKEDVKPLGDSDNSAAPATTSKSASIAPTSTPQDSGAPAVSSRSAAACISRGIKIRGEVTGSEDLFVDGLVDGKLNLTNGSLTIGPNGIVKADVNAREVIVRGKIEGKVIGRDKVQLWSTGQVTGEVQTERLAIEEGALLKGKVEAGKPVAKVTETKTAAVAASKSSDTTSLSTGTAAD